jgi:signal peptidase
MQGPSSDPEPVDASRTMSVKRMSSVEMHDQNESSRARQERQRSPSLVRVLFGLLVIVVALVTLGPRALGGPASYVIVSGNSMEPTFKRGDLVIVTARDRYEVGDVVTYQHPTIGPIIHRIIDRDGEQFILRGDNNDWLDSYRPTEAEIAGKQWVHLPRLGEFAARLKQPPYPFLLFGAVGVTMISASQSPARSRLRGRRGRSPLNVEHVSATPGSPPIADTADTPGYVEPLTLHTARGRELASTLGIALAALLLFGMFAFTRPVEHRVTRDIMYGHEGSFGWTADAPDGVYDGSSAVTGDPIFRKLTDEVAFTFDYHFTTDRVADVGGTYRLAATLADRDGWTRTLELTPTSEFTGRALSINGVLHLDAVQAIIDDVTRRTDVAHSAYTISIEPRIVLFGTLAGEDISETFAPALNFELDDLTMIPRTEGGDAAADPFNPRVAGVTQRDVMAQNRISLLRWDVAVRNARITALYGLGLTLAALAVLLLKTRRIDRGGEASRIQAQYGGLIVAVRDATAAMSWKVVSVGAFDDLLRLARIDGRAILHHESAAGHHYLVQVDDITYSYAIPARGAS